MKFFEIYQKKDENAGKFRGMKKQLEKF